jgi:HSP20 family molecular chaperone IbpA
LSACWTVPPKPPETAIPPYNIERHVDPETGREALRITLALAGFSAADLEVTVEDRELLVKGRQREEQGRDYLHRGIAARQFSRVFILADGMEVKAAELRNGLLTIAVHRVEPERLVRRIEVKDLN